MNRKFISLFMCPVLLILMMISVQAAEKENLFINGGFEKPIGSGGWGSVLNADYERVKTDPHEGEYCAKVVYDMPTETWIQDFRLNPGETYDFSMWAKLEKGKGELEMGAYFVYGYYCDGYNKKDGQIAYIDGKIGEQWTQIKGTFTYTGVDPKGRTVDDNAQFGLRFFNRYKEGGLTVYLDDFQLIPRGEGKESKRMPDTFKWDEDPLPQKKEVIEKNFTDMEGHWAKSTVEALTGDGIISGVSEKEFAPSSDITRAEFITLLTNSFKLREDNASCSFADVEKDKWYYTSITIAQKLGMIPEEMIKDNKFDPNRSITRGEASAVLVRYAQAAGNPEEKYTVDFTDKNSFGEYADAIEKAAAYGLINGYDDGTFKSSNTILRAEAAEMIKNAIELGGRRYFYVDYTNGNDKNEGTLSSPYKTLERAQKELRKYNKDMKGNIYVFLKDGEHYISKTLELTPDDSGTNGYNILYTSYGSGNAMLSGGETKVLDWTLYDEEKNIYRANVGSINTRNMFVNGIRATRARSSGSLKGYQFNRNSEYQITTTDTWAGDLTNNGEIELVHNGSYYCNFRPFVQEIKKSDNYTYFKLYDDFLNYFRDSNLYFALNLWIENAYELLDEEGEWYWNKQDGYLYYKPRQWEDLSTAKITLPKQSELITGKGQIDDNTYNPIHNIEFKNIDLGYTTYYNGYAQHHGLGICQDALLHRNDYNMPNDMVSGAITLENVSYIDFENCTFKKTGAHGAYIHGGVQHMNINGNQFYDIGADAVQVGELNQGERLLTPQDKRYYVADIHITNNYMHDLAVEMLAAGGMAVTNAQYSKISNNEIFRTSYSGIHIGYGFGAAAYGLWAKSSVDHNYIHNTNRTKYNLCDGGAVYFFGTTYGDMRDAITDKGRNKISYNYMEDLGTTVNSLYSDESVSWLEISHNVINYDKKYWTYGVITTGNQSKYNILKENYLRADTLTVNTSLRNPFTKWYEEDYPTEGMENIPGRNTSMGVQIGKHYIIDEDMSTWPEEAVNIKDNAGLPQEYLDKFPEEFQDYEVVGDDYGWIDTMPKDEQYLPAVFDMNSGDVRKIEVKATNRKKTEGYISPDRIYIANNSPDIVEVLPDNSIKALKKGKASLTMQILCGANKDVMETHPIEVYVDDAISCFPGSDKLVIYNNGTGGTIKCQIGNPVDINITFSTELGRRLKPLDINVTSLNENLVKVSDGKLIAEAEGEGNLKLDFVWGGNHKKESIEYDFKAIKHEMYMDFDKSQIVEVDDDFINLDNWTFTTPAMVREQTKNGFSASSHNRITYNKEKYHNKLLHFKMTVNHKGGWPSVALNCSDTNSSIYTEYILSFYEGTLELQRFNEGQRYPLWATGNAYDGTIPVYGGRPQCNFEYGKEYDVGVGIMDTDNGVRIYLYLDGLKVLETNDYINNDSFHLKNAPVLQGGGYFGIYSTSLDGSNIKIEKPDPVE